MRTIEFYSIKDFLSRLKEGLNEIFLAVVNSSKIFHSNKDGYNLHLILRKYKIYIKFLINNLLEVIRR